MFSNFILLGRTAPSSWSYYAAYTSSAIFTVPASGWYRIYCIGKSADGSDNYYEYGGGGGGSGGVAISNLLLSLNDKHEISISNGISKFGTMQANPGSIGNTSYGGSGGSASGGNIGNYSGFKGGDGGSTNARGEVGGNGGMNYGNGGNSNAPDIEPGGGGGGGGARLPGDVQCKYISPIYTSIYRAASGANQTSSNYNHATPYPEIVLSQELMLFGGGGGGGGRRGSQYTGGSKSSGTPAIVIIERPS